MNSWLPNFVPYTNVDERDKTFSMSGMSSAKVDKTLTVFHAYNKYYETAITKKVFAKNMQGKKHNTAFRQGIHTLLSPDSDDDLNTTFGSVMQEVAPRI